MPNKISTVHIFSIDSEKQKLCSFMQSNSYYHQKYGFRKLFDIILNVARIYCKALQCTPSAGKKYERFYNTQENQS